jgi:hypothetical protein
MLHDEIVALGSDSLQEYLDYMAYWPEFDKMCTYMRQPSSMFKTASRESAISQPI